VNIMFRTGKDRLQTCVEAGASTRRRHGGSWISGCAAFSIALLVLAPGSAFANESQALAKDGGIGAASALVSLIYSPVKIAYAAGGLVVGGLAWAFSGGDTEVASVVLTPSLRGDYVVTPSQLQGKEPIEFFGRKRDYEVVYEEVETGQDVAAAPPAEQLW
jgi:hypothetical protein